MRKILLLLCLLCALSLSYSAAAGPFGLTCPVNPVRSYLDITIESHAPDPDAANIFVYNLTGNYDKIGIPQGVVYRVDLSNLSEPTPTASICYALTGNGTVGVVGRVSFLYSELIDRCIDQRFVFCPLGADPGGPRAPLGSPPSIYEIARWKCLNGTLPNEPYFNSIIDNPIPPCTDANPAVYGNPSLSNAEHLLSHNELYLCNQTPKSYVNLCWPLMLIFGLLVGASFLLGRNPFLAFDLSSPRLGRGKQYSMRVQQERRDIMSYAMAGDQSISTVGKARDALRGKEEVILKGKGDYVKDKKTGKYKREDLKELRFTDKRGESNWSLFGLLGRATEKLAGGSSKNKRGEPVKGIARGPQDADAPVPEVGFSVKYSPSSTREQGKLSSGTVSTGKPTTSTYKPPLNVATSLSSSLFTAPSMLGTVGRIFAGNKELRKQWRKEAELMLGASEWKWIKNAKTGKFEKTFVKFLSGWQFFAVVGKMMAQNMGIMGGNRLEIANRFDLLVSRGTLFQKVADGLRFILEVYNTLNATTKLYLATPKGVIDFSAEVPGLKLIGKLKSIGPRWLKISEGRQFSIGEFADMVAEPNTLPYGSQWLAPIIGVVKDKAGALLTPAPGSTPTQFVKVESGNNVYYLSKAVDKVVVFDKDKKLVASLGASWGNIVDALKGEIEKGKINQAGLSAMLEKMRAAVLESWPEREFGEGKGRSTPNQLYIAIMTLNFDGKDDKALRKDFDFLAKTVKEYGTFGAFDALYTAFMQNGGLEKVTLGKTSFDSKGNYTLKKIEKGEFDTLAQRQIAWNNSQNKLDSYIIEALKPKFGDEFVIVKSQEEATLLTMLDRMGADVNALKQIKKGLKGKEELDAASITSLAAIGFDARELQESKGKASEWAGKLDRMIELAPYSDQSRVRLGIMDRLVQNRNNQNTFLQSMLENDSSTKDAKAKLLADLDNYYYLRQTASMSIESFSMLDANMNGGMWSTFAYWAQKKDKERLEEIGKMEKMIEEARKELKKADISGDPIESTIAKERLNRIEAVRSMMERVGGKLEVVPDVEALQDAYRTISDSATKQAAYRDDVSSIVLSGLQQGLDAGKLGSLLTAGYYEDIKRFGESINALEGVRDARTKEAIVAHFDEALGYLSETLNSRETREGRLAEAKMQSKLMEIEGMVVPVLTGIGRGVQQDSARRNLIGVGMLGVEGKKLTFEEPGYTVLDKDGKPETKKISELDESDLENGNVQLIQSQIALQTVKSYDELIGKGYLTDAGNISYEKGRMNANVTLYAANIEEFARKLRGDVSESERLQLRAQLDITASAMHDDLQSFSATEERFYSTSEKGAKERFYGSWRGWIDAAPFMRNPAADVLESISGIYDPFAGLHGFHRADPYELFSRPQQSGIGVDAKEVLESKTLLDSNEYKNAIDPSRLAWVKDENYNQVVEKIKDELKSRTLLASTDTIPEDVKAHLKKIYDNLLPDPDYQTAPQAEIDNTVLDQSAMTEKFIDAVREDGYTESQIRAAAGWLEEEIKRELEKKKEDKSLKQ